MPAMVQLRDCYTVISDVGVKDMKRLPYVNNYRNINVENMICYELDDKLIIVMLILLTNGLCVKRVTVPVTGSFS